MNVWLFSKTTTKVVQKSQTCKFSKKKYKKMQKNLVMSKKSSNFAGFFA